MTPYTEGPGGQRGKKDMLMGGRRSRQCGNRGQS